ncbi:hypothetical protein [Solibacillus sp. NPDC093137]|uniref:hypothetical protein n=1 Tax=Solibacillus sp. NPDC093137 TaxID=3390678 RepID=UPI003D022563
MGKQKLKTISTQIVIWGWVFTIVPWLLLFIGSFAFYFQSVIGMYIGILLYYLNFVNLALLLFLGNKYKKEKFYLRNLLFILSLLIIKPLLTDTKLFRWIDMLFRWDYYH